ncbi:hypothetical protein HMPREF0860_1803 [Treponema socranskii subsp. socranskii VPI DR56BR1116 = ATCC 35536]|uniref:Uncharacterized protein n=1 Tax=Treponema socranskii subsp. socranskii VPI DR56BR1116 = ATCC 35536 TaxID=1125725 RepID=U1FBC5_TRESO|nr:hypothetical protein HMPREF1325_0759 [Treponema socranskii subsp. socranskii VPI DR56BR1116 = ATCC 35536]ERJ98226.1 hypothetical protein HMPREF0860_1803 [Treponema socranskii subsp. socranskii VPI DR56BR1116 = ATCC 35536]
MKIRRSFAYHANGRFFCAESSDEKYFASLHIFTGSCAVIKKGRLKSVCLFDSPFDRPQTAADIIDY